MQPFTVLTAVALPLVRANIDTDAIIPSREMTSVSKKGLADGLFAGWRYRTVGGRDPNPDFVLNDPRYRGAAILLGGENFGCGSSREHAVWALAEYGFRAILAPSFNPIFRGNCVRNGIVPVELPQDAVAWIAVAVAEMPPAQLVTVDLEHQMVTAPDGGTHSFTIEPEAREMLLHGLDAIDLTLLRQAEIQGKRQMDKDCRPWVYL
ncbi:3-isopropylmalate dehydratase small subunit [Nitrospirillum sp. BR 11164]|uniref:3-isopropylmalate dehydratase small subunit n=1 Tax=Nitrospirillum sp. BR 11164 TaxID=3104324 RepID=UPI002AFF6DBD|nr:3-isopropylmalate dehydratase small subunit [Nitrospirillum sp. BR 11164]MEA1648076.1 3-isopropylmalate dehydratase small subunit [Nitrospirillum sp. BR 11164]